MRQSQAIFANKLTGVYLHGSLAMGCFNPQKSDIDIITVVNGEITPAEKRQYMDEIVRLNRYAPAKGIELSVVRRDICAAFAYPTPYELHFSPMHLSRYLADPTEYTANMHGTDYDLAAHFTIILNRGITLCGKPIPCVFGPVDGKYYMDSILRDIADAEAEIMLNPLYVTLNLCRAAAYAQEGLILSKCEGGEWAHGRVPAQYRAIVQSALDEYGGGAPMSADKAQLKDFAKYMLFSVRAKAARQ